VDDEKLVVKEALLFLTSIDRKNFSTRIEKLYSISTSIYLK